MPNATATANARCALGWSEIDAIRPRTRAQLARFTDRVLGLCVPGEPIIDGHQAPLDYLCRASLHDGAAEEIEQGSVDTIVWANRGGGKTMLGAVATLLDLLYRPGIQVRILGGSMEQSSKMYAYLREMLERPLFRGLLAGPPTHRRVTMANGSRVELLSQSQRSVRGQRIQRLRCDEIEDFEPDIWDAAQLTTRSAKLGGEWVRGGIEAMSTMHRPFGLMHRLIEQASEAGAAVLRWSAMDVIERCPEQRDCGACPLWSDCQGRAKDANGFLRIDDLIAQRARVSDQVWDAEMMCRRTSRSDAVYASFRRAHHVLASPVLSPDAKLIGGADFGLRSPTVMLWARVERDVSRMDARVEVVGEYVQDGMTLHDHLDAIEQLDRPRPEWVGVDPAGRQRNAHSGLTDIQVMQRRGYRVRSLVSRIEDGISLIQRRFDRGTLFISGQCPQLIEALTRYHFDPKDAFRETPVKDGPDHACDALRYMLVNFEHGQSEVRARSYL